MGAVILSNTGSPKIDMTEILANIAAAQATANAAMPKSGGTFTGHAKAHNANYKGGTLRNVEVYNSAHNAFVSTGIIVCVRK